MSSKDEDLPPRLLAMIQESALEATRAFLASRPTAQPEVAGRRLTPAQFAVARLMMAGSSGKEVARFLHISHRTVEVHRTVICKKLKVKTAQQAVVVLHLIGMVPDYRAPGAIPADLPKLEDLLP